jgi:hypothetical protein
VPIISPLCIIMKTLLREAIMIDCASYLALAALFGMLNSRNKRDPIDRPPKGALQYSGFDKNGKPVVRGWISLDVRESAVIDGEWCLDRVGDPGDIGPQLGLGTLTGRLEGADLYINLNPGFADFNVFLIGTYDGTTYKGKWRYSTVRGPASEGTFEAARKEKTADMHESR